MKFIKYIFSLFIIIFGINNVFANGIDVIFITKDIENPQERLCAFINDIVSSVNCVNYDDFENADTSVFNDKLIIFVFDENNKINSIKSKKLISILNLKNNKGIRVASFGENKSLAKFLAEHGRKYIPNLSENLDEIRRYVNRKVNGNVDSTSESYDKTINSSTEFSSEEMPANSKIDKRNYERSFFTPTKTALAGAGVKPITKSKKIKKSNINISTLNFNETVDEKTTNPSSENVQQNKENEFEINKNISEIKEAIDSKPQEETQIYIGTPKAKLQNDNEVIERYKEETKIEINEKNSTILPSDKKDEVEIVLSTENSENEKEHLIPKEEKIKKKKGCCIIL